MNTTELRRRMNLFIAGKDLDDAEMYPAAAPDLLTYGLEEAGDLLGVSFRETREVRLMVACGALQGVRGPGGHHAVRGREVDAINGIRRTRIRERGGAA